MKKLFLKYCRPYRWLFNKLFGKYNIEKLSIPFDIYGNFKFCYLGFDKDGNVQKGFANIVDALKNKGELGLTVLYDKH